MCGQINPLMSYFNALQLLLYDEVCWLCVPKYYIEYMLTSIGFSAPFIAHTSTVKKLINCRSNQC